MSTHSTPIADYDAHEIQALLDARGWRALTDHERIGAAYAFVRDELPFGYNRDDALPASEVLADGYGQCNTKGNLLLALLRGLGIEARFHGFTIHKALQRGAIPEPLYRLAPARILHSWVEVLYAGAWVPLEGFILDRDYLSAIQARFPTHRGAFCGFGIASPSLRRPAIEWSGAPTYIQREGIADDFGVFEDPDDFYRAHGTNLGGARRWLYQNLLRHWLNYNVRRLRTPPPRRLPSTRTAPRATR